MKVDQRIEGRDAERRSDQRHRTVYRPAYVRVGEELHFVTMRNVSHDGASFIGLAGLQLGQEIFYCVGNSSPISACVKWYDGERFGVENVVERIEDLTFADSRPYRSVRLPVTALAQIYYLGCRFDGILHNLSQTGACVDANIFFTTGELLTIQIGGMAIESTEIKWVEGTRVGVKFARPLDRTAISQALEQLQCRTQKHGHQEIAVCSRKATELNCTSSMEGVDIFKDDRRPAA